MYTKFKNWLMECHPLKTNWKPQGMQTMDKCAITIKEEQEVQDVKIEVKQEYAETSIKEDKCMDEDDFELNTEEEADEEDDDSEIFEDEEEDELLLRDVTYEEDTNDEDEEDLLGDEEEDELLMRKVLAEEQDDDFDLDLPRDDEEEDDDNMTMRDDDDDSWLKKLTRPLASTLKNKNI